MVRNAKTLVSNGGKSRAGEKRKNPRKSRAGEKRKNPINPRDPKKRKLENQKATMNRKAENIEHEKNGLYKCQGCRIVKPESLFPGHIPTSGKLTRYETCTKCLDGRQEINVLSGVTQLSRDRNATRAIGTQLNIKANLKDKPGFEEYKAECDAANPPTMFKIRCTKEEMGEKFPLVDHGRVDSIHSNCFS